MAAPPAFTQIGDGIDEIVMFQPLFSDNDQRPLYYLIRVLEPDAAASRMLGAKQQSVHLVAQTTGDMALVANPVRSFIAVHAMRVYQRADGVGLVMLTVAAGAHRPTIEVYVNMPDDWSAPAPSTVYPSGCL